MTRIERVFRADRGDLGRRLDHVLQRHLADRPDATRSRIQHWIRSGEIFVNGMPATKVAGRVSGDAEVAVRLPPLPPRDHAPERIPLEIIYEDAELMVVNKPAGLIAHPSYRHAAGTLMNALLWYAHDWPAPARPSLVHRLDKHTSGLLVVAKSRGSHARLARALSDRRVQKDYLAIVLGRVQRPRGDIALPLGRDPADRRRVIVHGVRARPSVTRYERLEQSRGRQAGIALVRCRLLTGRMHQIRVHLAASGWPIVGDPAYGPRGATGILDSTLDAAVRTFPRQALHSWRLAFHDPASARRLEIEAPVPTDMAALLATAGIPS
jgi:23S rRNA pseudouridine1911/1915/1917 synthase